jgi:hypothetical protein
MSLRDDIAVTESRLGDLFGKVDSGESGAVWQALRAVLEAFGLAQRAGDVATMQQHFTSMRELVTKGSADYAAWAEIYTVWGQRCKLVQT